MAQVAKRRPQQAKPPTRRVEAGARSPRGVWLTRLAFGLLLAVVIARLMMLEAIRSAVVVAPDSPPVPAGPGPAAGLVLDLLACAAALLVLGRRWADPTFSLRLSWSMAPMAALGAWAVLSTAWAGDKFAALVSSFHLLSALVALWAAAQVVRTWAHLRIVAGVCVGVLFVMVAQGAYYELSERPALVETWQRDSDEILRQRGIQRGTFEAIQFENKVLRGELMGFNASPNTFAALIVLTMVVAIGAAADRYVRTSRGGAAGDRSGLSPTLLMLAVGAVVLVVVVLPAGWMIRAAQSRAAYLTPVLALSLLAGVAVLRGWIGRRAGLAYAIVAAGFVLVTAAVVGHGLHHGTLFHDSLNFRWRYWVGSGRLFRLHPLLGVGWENFGPHYLGTRLPTATEEIRDPHNFIVRFFVELGTVGGAFALAWVARLWWELTRPSIPATPVDPPAAPVATRGDAAIRVSPSSLGAIVGIAAAGVALNVAASIDFAQDASFAALELFRRAVFLLLLALGTAAVALRVRPEVELDERPAPWLLYAVLVGLGVFLLHNLIDFSLFETGPLFLFAVLGGAALGIRLPARAPSAKGTKVAAVALAGGAAAWLAALVALVVPVAAAEAVAADADEMVRRGRVPEGAAALERAFARVPANGDYAYRAAQAWRMAGRVDRARAMLAAAAAAQPSSAGYRVSLAEFETEQPAPDLPRARGHFEEAVRLDPNNVGNHIRLAEVLEKLQLPQPAAQRYAEALSFNDQLTREEKKRLPEEKVNDIRNRIARLTGK